MHTITLLAGADDHIEEDQKNCLLVSRIACLGRLTHSAEGYSGVLNRQLAGFSSMVHAVGTNLRSLVETCLVTLLLNGDADREAIDVGDVAMK